MVAGSCEEFFADNPSAHVAHFSLDGGDRKERAHFERIREDDRIRGTDVVAHEYLETLAVRFDMVLVARCGHCLECQDDEQDDF